MDDLLDLPDDTFPEYPPCPRCFSLTGVRRTGPRPTDIELWCSYCLTIAVPRKKPRGATWEARGFEAHLGEARAWTLEPLTPQRLAAANAEAQARRAEWMAKRDEERRRSREAERKRAFDAHRGS